MLRDETFVAAVDGGQSSTLALIAALDGQIIGVGRGGASNHIHEPGGLERLTSALTDSLTNALNVARQPPEQIINACLGLSGGAEIAHGIAARLLPNSEITV